MAEGRRYRAPPEPEDTGHYVRDRLRTLRYLLPLARLVWETSRGLSAAMVALRLARSLVPVAALWVGKLILDEVVAASGRQGAELTRLWQLVALEALIVLLGEALARGSALVESLLADLFSIHSSVRLMGHAATLELAQFEDPDFYDRLERARRQTTGRLGLIVQLLVSCQEAVTLVSLAAALLFYNPWLLLLLVVAILPGFLGTTHFAGLEYSLLYRQTPERRQLDYLRMLGASERAAKEVKMFDLAPWLIERYRSLSNKFYEENRRLAVRRGVVSTLLAAVGMLGYYGAYVSIIWQTVRGAASIGTLTFLTVSFARSRDIIQRLLTSLGDIYGQSLYLKDLFEFLETEPSDAARSGDLPVPRPIREGFVFEDVGFRYPGSERWAVRHVSFTLRPGERLALVGENGAGKTTLTKLLTRLYDPTEGRVLLEGVDLREYDLGSLRRAVGVIFQDFARYDFRLDENIGVGEIGETGEYLAAVEESENGSGADGDGVSSRASREEVHARIVAAAEKSLADTLARRLPGGYRQVLGTRFEGGVELSGGEWQKIALARAYIREAQLLILDEPTAALDARAEYEVFRLFSELVSARTAVIISHRFSTVRMAHRILVLEGGTIAEQGTHEELLGRGGLYATLFNMQAGGYR